MTDTWEISPAIAWPWIAAILAVLAIGGAITRRWLVGPPFQAVRPAWIATRVALLGALLFVWINPTRTGSNAIQREASQLCLLVDSSRSMQIGTSGNTRWDQAKHWIEHSPEGRRIFQFGNALRSVDDANALVKTSSVAGLHFDADSRLATALRDLTTRIVDIPPAGVVVISDGRISDAADLSEVADRFVDLGVPIHVAPCGSPNEPGDVAAVSLILPSAARKRMDVLAQVMVRSYGLDGERTDIDIEGLDAAGAPRRLANIPIIPQDGRQTFELAFPPVAENCEIRASIRPLSKEIKQDNNSVSSRLSVDRTHLRVLYLDGSIRVSSGQQVTSNFGGGTISLEMALETDENIACTTLRVAENGFVSAGGLDTFPGKREELFAFDSIIMHDVPRSALSDESTDWILEWIQRRGGGLAIVGGPSAFAAEWMQTPLAEALPITLSERSAWRDGMDVSLRPLLDPPAHPLLRLSPDEYLNKNYWSALPILHGAQTGIVPRSNLSTVLATFDSVGSDEPAIVVRASGRGRTLAMATPLTGDETNDLARWGHGDAQHFKQFWQGAVYWLSENSSLGRRNLDGVTDKRVYYQGETVTIRAMARDTSGALRPDYRVAVTLIPADASTTSLDSPLQRFARPENHSGPLPWDEPIELAAREKSDDLATHEIQLQASSIVPGDVADTDLQLEFTSYDGETLLDSCTAPLSVVYDPVEERNLTVNHSLLHEIARRTGGQVLLSSQSLSALTSDVTVNTSRVTVEREPVWNHWWMLATVLGILTLEWYARRPVDMA